MDYNETAKLVKILELSQELKKEIEQAKVQIEDFQDGEQFNLEAYLDSLFGAGYNEIEDADIEEDGEQVAEFLSSCPTKDLVISLIISLCVNRAINIGDIVSALDNLKKIQK